MTGANSTERARDFSIATQDWAGREVKKLLGGAGRTGPKEMVEILNGLRQNTELDKEWWNEILNPTSGLVIDFDFAQHLFLWKRAKNFFSLELYWTRFGIFEMRQIAGPGGNKPCGLLFEPSEALTGLSPQIEALLSNPDYSYRADDREHVFIQQPFPPDYLGVSLLKWHRTARQSQIYHVVRVKKGDDLVCWPMRIDD